MRAELPWNVAGIPPEAREAARAAARREGLSVGEWLTRRILRSFSDLGEEPMPFDRGSYGGSAPAYGAAPALDSWGLPQSGAARRDTEEMLARVSRSEVESSETWRRIEDQLRGVTRRLDSSERSQSENNRVLSKTAAEVNVAAREQAQVFDQIGQNIGAINERLERLERERASDGVKDAVKALHQGLSRLADQIGQTANQSAAQVTMLTQNLEQLAHRMGQAREDAEHAEQKLDQRIGEVDARVAQVDDRIAQVEKSSQFTTNAIDHALEKLEAQANQRATDQVEWQRRAGASEENLLRLEDSVARLERAGADQTLERRLDGVENGFANIVARLETYNPAAPLEDGMHAMSRRLESLEKQHNDLLNEMRANIVAAPQGPAPSFAAPAPAFEAPFEAPPFAEPAHGFAEPPAAPADESFLPPYGTDAFSPDAFAAGQFTPVADETDPFAPLGDMVEPAPAEEENFLAAARRSAREAAEKSQSEKGGRFNLFRRRVAVSSQPVEGRKSRLLMPVAVAGAVALLAIAAAVLSQRLNHSAAPATPPAAPADNRPFNEAPAAGMPEEQAAASQEPQQAAPQEQQQAAPAAEQPAPARPQGGGASLEHTTQLANAGNAIAQTVLGLRALDGTPANAAEAFKWLSKAADQGQPVAQYRLGTLYELGQGVTANPATAQRWYQASANQGNRKAMHNLAHAFASGFAGKANMAEAARWFSRAAGLGLTDSQFNLAVLYERGDGVPQSLLDAYKWYAIATAAGDTESKQRMSVLQTQLSDADKAAAQRSAGAFKAAPLSRAANVPPEPADVPAN